MSLNLVSPGVKVREVDLTIGRVDGANDQVGAIAGPFKIGPVDEVVDIAKEVANKSLVATMMTKEMVNRAYETTLAEGVRFERRLFHSMFATKDKAEGMSAFIEKRKPEFKDE